MMSWEVPPPLPRTRTGTTLAPGATPAPPTPTPPEKLVAAATVPATWVPCQEEEPAAPESPGSSGLASMPSPSLARTGSEMKS